MVKIISLTLFLILASAAVAQKQEKLALESWISEADAVLAGTDSYSAIFHKQEKLDEGLSGEETIYLKFKKPFKVYMKWIKTPYTGRELLYAEGWNNNRLKAHEGGILGIVNVNLDPKSVRAMKGNRHPITDTGLENLVRVIGKDLRKGLRAGNIGVIDHGEETVYERKTRKFEGIFPKDKTRGYYCYRAVINLDIEKKVPLRVMIYDWDDNLIENYGYEGLKLDAGLTNADFDPKNPAYRF